MTTVDVPDSSFSQRCLQELREAREKALTECSISNLQIVGEVTLRDMLAKLPTNKKILLSWRVLRRVNWSILPISKDLDIVGTREKKWLTHQ